MSEAKFTKGEWIVDYDNCDHGSGEWYVIGNAKVEFSYRATTEEREEAKANANLIASAPDMYEAISEIYQVLNRFDSESLDFIELHVGSLENLLAKARGEK